MKHRTIFLFAAIVLFLYGLLWFVVPTFGLTLHGHDVVAHDVASTIARYWGSAYLALAVLLWVAKDGDSDSIAVRGITAGGVVLCITGLFAAIMNIVYTSTTWLTWVAAGLYVVFGIWLSALFLKKKA